MPWCGGMRGNMVLYDAMHVMRCGTICYFVMMRWNAGGCGVTRCDAMRCVMWCRVSCNCHTHTEALGLWDRLARSIGDVDCVLHLGDQIYADEDFGAKWDFHALKSTRVEWNIMHFFLFCVGLYWCFFFSAFWGEGGRSFSRSCSRVVLRCTRYCAWYFFRAALFTFVYCVLGLFLCHLLYWFLVIFVLLFCPVLSVLFFLRCIDLYWFVSCSSVSCSCLCFYCFSFLVFFLLSHAAGVSSRLRVE